jgi:hypothetical protein
MPASLPGSSVAENLGNPATGRAVIFDPLSGPKGSPLDARKIDSWSAGLPVYSYDANNLSTGALSTGIGYGSPPIFGSPLPFGVVDDYIPGQDLPSSAQAANASIMYIGGGLSDATGAPVPIAIGAVGLCMAGNGGSRDGGAGPKYTGFPTKLVTATGAVNNGAAVEAGFINRSGVALVSGQSVYGSSTTPLTAPA